MAQKKNTIPVTFRCDVDVVEKLDEICKLSGIKRGDFLINSILAEYDRLQGNPQMRKMLEQLREISETMKQLTAEN